MANDLTNQVLQVDTAAVIYSTAKAIGKIVWSGMTSGHVLQIEDENGEIMYKVTANGNNAYYEFDFKGMITGFEVATIQSGLLLVYPFMGNY